MAMPEKRQPLAVMIAMHAKKPNGDSDMRDHGDGDMTDDEDDNGDKPEHDDEGLLQACEDVIDAVKSGDAKALNKALVSWQDLYESHDEDDEGDQ
jgi:hypothetical protein